MKKIFTLTLTLIILSTAAFSQTIVSRVSIGTSNFSIDFGRRINGNRYSFTSYERDQRLHSINSVYNQQVASVMNLRIGYGKKMELIHQLQVDRSNRIAEVNARFFDRRNVAWNGRRFNDDDDYAYRDQYNDQYQQQNSPYQHYDGYTR